MRDRPKAIPAPAAEKQVETFAQARGVASIKSSKRGDSLDNDADHYTIGAAVITSTIATTGHRPVYALGMFWRVADGVWVSCSLDALAVEVGALFGGHKYCRRGSDFNAIARIVAGLCADERYFEEAPVGIAAGGHFWRVAGGRIIPEPLTAEHRQRMRLPAEPDFKAAGPLFERLLDHAFHEDIAQRELLQILFGAALTRCLWRLRIATLLLGKTTTGRTTILNVLARVFPSDLVAATNPQKWANEYYRAALAGKALNIVGELDPSEPIPGGAFKSVVGCDVIEGRHPTHRPFSFVCTAAMFFNANSLPPTLDHSDAFFRRWRIIEFNHVVTDAKIIEGLAERIIAEELPAVLAWMLEGAVMLQTVGGIPETTQHKRLLAKWRAANNSALQFLLDPSMCALDSTADTKGELLFTAYRKWAFSNGMRPFGRNGFYDAIDEGAGRLAVRREEECGAYLFKGVRLCQTST